MYQLNTSIQDFYQTNVSMYELVNSYAYCRLWSKFLTTDDWKCKQTFVESCYNTSKKDVLLFQIKSVGVRTKSKSKIISKFQNNMLKV